MTKKYRLPALRIQQGDGNHVFSCAIDGKTLHSIATVSRVSRDEDREISGYQRPEVRAHVAAIRSYIESPGAMIPNSLVVAFDERVTWEPSKKSAGTDATQAESGFLVVPSSDDPEWDRPGWIVDGQQRAAALRDARVDHFPMFVSAFVTDSAAVQRSQFILVNSTKPLPKGLILELLPTTEGKLPPALVKKRFPAYLLERLNFDEDSPLRLRIRTPTQPEGVTKDNSVLKMLENSLTDGSLYPFRDPVTGAGDSESMLAILKTFWAAVRDTFPEAWDLPPRKSRLMHGVGVMTLGFMMDAIADETEGGIPDYDQFVAGLELIEDACAWTGGYWEFQNGERRKWNEVQNTPKDVQLIASHITLAYRRRKLAPLLSIVGDAT